MQIQPVIMRLLVILSASLMTAVVRAGTLVSRSDFDVVTTALSSSPVVGGGGETGSAAVGGGAVLFLRRPPGVTAPASVGLPRQRSIQHAGLAVGAQSTAGGHRSFMSSGAVPEKNVYRTKLSKLKLILLADMLNDMPAPLELITCLANSSTLNVTTKHCECETYSCKDLLTSSSSSSPFNSVNQRKIHTSCRDYCCRKKKFNRSIDPTVQNAVAAAFRHKSLASMPPADQPASDANGLAASPSLSSTSPLSSSSSSVARQSPARRSCEGSIVNQIAISNNEDYGSGEPAGTNRAHPVRQPQQHQQQYLSWLYRVILIEKGLTICAGTLIHPSVLLTTAVCVINKNPDQLIVRRQSIETSRIAAYEEQSRAIRRIVIPDQYATTFERLENNVALLVLEQDKGKQQPSDEEDNLAFKQALFSNISRTVVGTGNPIPALALVGAAPSTSWRQQHAEAALGNRRNNSSPPPLTTQDPPEDSFHQPSAVRENAARSSQPESSSYICLSSIINHPSPAMSNICQTYSWRKLRKSARSSAAATGGAGSRRRQRRNQRAGQQRSRNVRQSRSNRSSGDDGTNYVTANISIFPANGSECRREHRDYLQHHGNLCAGPQDKTRSLQVDLSGSPLICTERRDDGTARVELRGLLTWSTDINRAPHLFTNLTTYRSWIEDELDKLDQLELVQQSS
ncbi:uncharacterized protein LOC134219839 isoform X2 [Armigeres subalbatus]|uniref:uncharacterized protein LOC134219839 isoform X2 n=1 Tax=Armigeres subalbatus TaxID=124917 RepID=UPI002ED4883C